MSKIGTTPSEQESLRLMLAYLQIPDPGLRRRLLDLAESYANESAEPPAQDIAQDNLKPSADTAPEALRIARAVTTEPDGTG